MKKILTLLITLLPVMVLAHEGHGSFHGTGWHYLTAILHVVPIIAVAAISWFIVSQCLKYFRKRTLKK